MVLKIFSVSTAATQMASRRENSSQGEHTVAYFYVVSYYITLAVHILRLLDIFLNFLSIMALLGLSHHVIE